MENMTIHLLTLMGSYHKVCLAKFHFPCTLGSIFSPRAPGNIQAKTPRSHGPLQIECASTKH